MQKINIYQLLSTWITTWTEPEAFYEYMYSKLFDPPKNSTFIGWLAMSSISTPRIFFLFSFHVRSFKYRSKQFEKWLHDFFQTMSGSETIAYYCLDIFKRAKVTLINNYTLSILLQTAFTTGYVVSAFIMNHVPRRIQFMSSALFMAVSTATLGFTLNQSAEVCIPWVLSMSLVQCIWFNSYFKP